MQLPQAENFQIEQHSPSTAQDWAKALFKYRQPDDLRALFELFITAVPLAALWGLMAVSLQFSYLLTAALALPTAGFLLRTFMIQHDCGHGSFFKSRAANDWIGRIAGVFTLTPYSFWKNSHALHHSGSGCLEKRGSGDIDTMTVSEYRAATKWQRWRYRLYRHPLVMFGIGPSYLFLLQHRLPAGSMRGGWRPWASVMGTNLSVVIVVAIAIHQLGALNFALIYLPVVLIAASIGVWLFFVQHQFEHTSWDELDEWNLHSAALHGSSHYDLPPVLRWITANIGIHHVHHLCSRIPYYRLCRVLEDYPELNNVSRLTLTDSFGCVRLVLWDESKRRLVSFHQAA
ncbi:MAG: fatty acid desaturase [Hyphomicrobiales bacterium]